MSDLDYTLRAIPNHHRALYAVGRHELSDGVDPNFRSARCYFDRAIRFRPMDPIVRFLFGVFLASGQNLDEALEQYQTAQEMGLDSPELDYNFGLLYLEMDDPDAALAHARNAYDQGYPLPGLREKLRSAGIWSESD
jgi:tetratricopeptide (TPR) repeat protein